MGESPPDRCGYEWPTDCERSDIQLEDAYLPSCCVRETAAKDSDRCIWHANSEEVGNKTVETLTEVRTPKEIRERNRPINELLDGAILQGCDLDDFQLNKISLRGADLTSTELGNSDLKKSDLSDANLSHISLVEANLTNTRLLRVELVDANLKQADLSNANIKKSNLKNADLRRAVLKSTILWRSDLNNVNLKRSDLTDAELWESDLTDAYLSRAEMANTALRQADLTNAYLPHANLTDAGLSDAILTDAVLQNVDLTNAILLNADLTDADLPGANLSNSNLERANLTNTYLWKAELTDAYLRNANLTKTILKSADLTGVYLGEANIINTNFRNANLTNAVLQDANLINIVLEEANLTDANFMNVDVTGYLERANLTRTNLLKTDLRNTKFYGAITTDTQINNETKFGSHYTSGSNIEKATWSLSRIEELSRQNALPDQIRKAFIKRKDRRRNHYWHHSKVPGWLDMYVRRLKISVSGFLFYVKSTLKRWTNAADPPVILFINWLRAQIHGTNPEIYSNTSNDISVDQPTQASNEYTNAEPETIDANTDDTGSDDTESDLTNWKRYINTAKWGWLAVTGAIMRYGESARRVVTLSLLTILAFGMAYPFVGGIEDDGIVYTIQFTSDPSLAGLAAAGEALLRNLYFSTITFTTIGYANVAPAGPWSRLFVGIESFLGALLMALLVFVLGRRSTR